MKYTPATQGLTQKREGEKYITYPCLEPNQSIKLTREISLTSTNALNQDHKLHTKEFLILWIEIPALSNTSKFLSFHTIQKKHRGHLPSLVAGFTHKGTMPPRECLLNREGENSSHTKERKHLFVL